MMDSSKVYVVTCTCAQGDMYGNVSIVGATMDGVEAEAVAGLHAKTHSHEQHLYWVDVTAVNFGGGPLDMHTSIGEGSGLVSAFHN